MAENQIRKREMINSDYMLDLLERVKVCMAHGKSNQRFSFQPNTRAAGFIDKLPIFG